MKSCNQQKESVILIKKEEYLVNEVLEEMEVRRGLLSNPNQQTTSFLLWKQRRELLRIEQM